MKNRIRVACVGNIANNFFREVQALNRYTDIEAVLYLHKGTDVSNTALPESDDPNLADSYPDWIRVLPEFSNFKRDSAFGIKPKSTAFKRLITELNSYDICMFSSVDVFYIQYLTTCTIYRATGSDLTVLPVFSYHQFFQLRPNGKVKMKEHPIQFIKQIIAFYLRRSNYRRALRQATFINSGMEKPFQIALKKLNIPKERQIDILPLAIDTDLFFRDTLKAQQAIKRWGLQDKDFIVFMPSRMMIKQSYVHKVTGQWKASDVAIQAYTAFLDSLNVVEKSKTVLVIPDRTQSDDLEVAKSLIHKLKIEGNIKFVKGDSNTGLTRHELIQLYSISDVVLDDFGAGWYGSVVVEAMSCSCPVITYVTKSLMEKFSWHPIQCAQMETEIYLALQYLFKHPHEKEQIGIRSRYWVEEFHSQKKVSEHLEQSLKYLLE